MRMVPEGAGIGRRELVDETLPRPDRRLGQAWHAVHGVWQADAVPMDGGVLIEPVLDRDADRLALPQAQCRAGDGAVIGPHGSGRTVRAGEPRLTRRDLDQAFVHGGGAPGTHRRGYGSARHCREKPAARHGVMEIVIHPSNPLRSRSTASDSTSNWDCCARPRRNDARRRRSGAGNQPCYS